jgi:hypothetical protein
MASILTISSSSQIFADPYAVADAVRHGYACWSAPADAISAEALTLLAQTIDAQEEEEATAFMSSLRPKDTGLDNALWFSVKYGRHLPRIKIAVDPSDRISPFGGTTAVMLIETGELVEGKLSERTRKQIAEFVAEIRPALLGYWDADETGIDEDAVKEAAKQARKKLGL